MAQLRIAIIGAGIAGLATAGLLARQGHRITVFEKQTALQPAGAGILLQPVALEVLQELQVLAMLQAGAARIVSLVRHSTLHRACELHYRELAAERYGLGVARGDLIAALSGGVRLRCR